MLRNVLALLLALQAAIALAQEPTPARSDVAEPRQEKIDAATAAKILTETYERTKDATSADDFGSVIELCERALAADPPDISRATPIAA